MPLFLTVFISALFLFVKGVSAQDPSRATARDMASIQKKLTVVEQKLDQLIAGQKKLSEEHTQLRYWINKRR